MVVVNVEFELVSNRLGNSVQHKPWDDKRLMRVLLSDNTTKSFIGLIMFASVLSDRVRLPHRHGKCRHRTQAEYPRNLEFVTATRRRNDRRRWRGASRTIRA